MAHKTQTQKRSVSAYSEPASAWFSVVSEQFDSFAAGADASTRGTATAKFADSGDVREALSLADCMGLATDRDYSGDMGTVKVTVPEGGE